MSDIDREALVFWATELLAHSESSISSYRTPKSTCPYREWFHECEDEVVAALGVRFALGLEIPKDIRDIAGPLVEAARVEIQAERDLEGDDE